MMDISSVRLGLSRKVVTVCFNDIFREKKVFAADQSTSQINAAAKQKEITAQRDGSAPPRAVDSGGGAGGAGGARRSHEVLILVGLITGKMNSSEFRKRGQEMVDFICSYLENIESRRVTPCVEPGYLKHLLPLEAPMDAEPWEAIMEDVESKIMPGVKQTQRL